ncbi:unnamed protein product [Symbiodinium natans]|uniref:Uncharacterized protein n=1 Tax=Symbiodinium natans TaxID=878477 RepID=A0A812M4M2_9DINO|nr:unnamed protein product [Symbiodinium natans]
MDSEAGEVHEEPAENEAADPVTGAADVEEVCLEGGVEKVKDNPSDKLRVSEATTRASQASSGRRQSLVQRSVSRISTASEMASQALKSTSYLLRAVIIKEVVLRQFPMAYVVTVPTLLMTLLMSQVIRPSQRTAVGTVVADLQITNTSIYTSWLPWGRDELHATAYAHFEWYPFWEVLTKWLNVAIPAWVVSRLILGKEKFWQENWVYPGIAYAFYAIVIAWLNICGALVGHDSIDTSCVPAPYPAVNLLAILPVVVAFSMKMKRVLGTRHFLVLVSALLMQATTFTVEYIFFVRDAGIWNGWGGTDLVIVVYKYTLRPLIWSLGLGPVVRHVIRSLDVPITSKPALVIIFCIWPQASGRLLLFTLKSRGTFALSAVVDVLISMGGFYFVPEIDKIFWYLFQWMPKFAMNDRLKSELKMVRMIFFQVSVSVETGTALMFSLLPALLYSERLIFQRMFARCQAEVNVEQLFERLGISAGLMVAEDILLSIVWLKKGLPLTQAFDIMFSSRASWVALTMSYLSIFLTVVTAGALLPEAMECQNPFDVCSCLEAHMFAAICGCCGSNPTSSAVCTGT